MHTDELEALLDERAICHVLHSYCRAIDRRDVELLRDCYWPDATNRHGPFTGTRDEYAAWVMALLRRHIMTMHQLGNILIDLNGDTAHADTFGRRDDQWRIINRVTAIEWTHAWEADRERIAAFGDYLPRRDHTDPAYGRPT